MIIITRASRRGIEKPGVRCWNVPESLSWYRASIVTFWSSESLPAWTAASAAIMIEILRVLADGTGTAPRRSALAPVARSLRYQLAWNFSASHSSLRRLARSRIEGLLSILHPEIRPVPYRGPIPSGSPQPPPRRHLDWDPRPRESTEHGRHADPRRNDRHGRRHRRDSLRRRAPRPRRPHRRARADHRAARASSGRGADRWARPGDPAGLRQHAHPPLPRAGARHLRGPLAPHQPPFSGCLATLPLPPLTPDEERVMATLGALEAIRSGTTLVLEEGVGLDGYAGALIDTGLRLVLCERVWDRANASIGQTGPFVLDPALAETGLTRAADFHARWHGKGDGRLRAGLAAWAPDTCSPERISS